MWSGKTDVAMNLIADEFSDEERITTANFHCLAAGFFRGEDRVWHNLAAWCLIWAPVEGAFYPFWKKVELAPFLVDLVAHVITDSLPPRHREDLLHSLQLTVPGRNPGSRG